MGAEALRERLAAFLPRTLWPLIARAEPGARVEGGVLFADLAGFTPLTESLAKIGKEGAEELTRILNDFFAAMIAIVHGEGGDVLRFGGDAMTLFFPGGVENGLRAALRMQREAQRFHAIATRGGTFALGMKVGIASGPVLFGTVGDAEAGRDYFAAGLALDLAAEAEHHAVRGQIALSPSAAKALSARGWAYNALEDGFGLIEDPLAVPLDGASADGETGFGDAPTPEDLEAFLPRFVCEKARRSEGLSVAEHRRTTVLFLAFGGLDYEGDEEVQEKVRLVYGQIAAAVRRFGGWVNKLDMGDKGSKVIALFGAPFALEHQEEMACRAALAILADPELRARLSDCRIGITVSPLFAAYVGSDRRREYTVMGDGINMAARLMANAHSWRVLASREVMEQAGGALAFRALDPIFVKGKTDKVAIFRPEGEREADVEHRARFVGRRDMVAQVIPGLLEPSVPLLTAVVGDPGVGKSALLHRLGAGMDEAGLRHVTIPLVAHSAHSYMSAWKSVLLAAMGVSRAAPPEIRLEALKAAAADEDPGYLPLFNPLVGLDTPDTESTSALTAKDRKDVLFAMLARIVLKQAEGAPYGVFLDQLEYADPASLEFLQVLVGETGGRPLKLLVAYRAQYASALKDATAAFQPLALPPLSLPELKDYLVQVAGTTAPTETFLEFLHKKTGGNPKFLEQILAAMGKEGILAKGPSGLLEVDEDRLAATTFPDTLEGLLLSRADGLPENERSVVKAASVLGSSFSLNLLQTLMEEPQGVLFDAIRSLEDKGIIRMDTWGARPYATFTDSLLRDALYESLNFSVKRSFHGRVADLLERQGAGERKLWPALAHHFEAAGDVRKATGYLWEAAEDARSRYDNLAAFNLLGRYVALSEKSGATVKDDGQFRKGLLYLAEASKDLQRLDEADQFSRRILDGTPQACSEMVISLMRLADNQRRRGKVQEALDIYARAMDQAKELHDRELECRILVDSGVPLAMSGRMDEAMARFQEAESLARKIGATTSLVVALMNQGLCHYHGGGHFPEALAAFRKARRIAATHGLKPALVNITVNLSQVLFDTGRYRDALRAVKEGITISRQFGYRQLHVAMLANRALYQVALGQWDEALVSSEEADTIGRHYGLDHYVANNLHARGTLLGIIGDLRGALACQNASIAIHLEGKATSQALGCLAEILALANQWREPAVASRFLTQNPELLEAMSKSGNSAWELGLRAQWLGYQYQCHTISSGEAIDGLDLALAEAQSQSALWVVAEIAEMLVRLLLQMGRPEEAAKAGMKVLDALRLHYFPQKVAPFLLVLCEALHQTDNTREFGECLRALKRYEPFMDRGLVGMRYHTLMSRVAELDHRKKLAKKHRDKARIIEAKLDESYARAKQEAGFKGLDQVSSLFPSPH